MRRQTRAMRLSAAVVALLAIAELQQRQRQQSRRREPDPRLLRRAPPRGRLRSRWVSQPRPRGAAGPFVVAINFGDGTAATATSVGHVYSNAGTYSARFSASGSNGSTADCSTTITVQAPPPGPAVIAGNQPPDAVFKTDPVDAGGTISGTAPSRGEIQHVPDHRPRARHASTSPWTSSRTASST